MAESDYQPFLYISPLGKKNLFTQMEDASSLRRINTDSNMENSGKINPLVSSASASSSSVYRDFSSSGNHESSAINDSIEALKPSFMVFMLAILTCFCGFMFGYDTGYISGALVVIGEDLGEKLSSGDKELITSATSLGAFITALIGGGLADTFGRKWVISFANIMFIVGGGMQTGAHTKWTMIVGRFIMGWGVGLASLVAPIYLSEVAPTRFRGRLVVLNVLAITLGQLIAYGIGAGLAHTHNGWRILVGLSLIPSGIQMILFIFMPETPRYLVLRDRLDEARKVISKVYQGATEKQLNEKITEIKADTLVPPVVAGPNATRSEKAKAAFQSFCYNFKELFRYPANRRALSIVVALQLFQQFSGWNALMYYSGTMFKSVGFDDPTSVSIIIAATNFVFTIVAFLIIDKVGRRVLLVGTMWGMSLGLVICAVAFHYLPFDSSDSAEIKNVLSGPEQKWGIVVIVFVFVFAASYATGIGNVPWQQSEMLPMNVRGIGTSFATAANWAGSLVVSATFLTMLNNITPTGTFAFYAGICALGEVLAIFFYPETAGLNLEEVHTLLEGGYRVKESVRLSKQKRQLYNARH